ncbi:MAG: methionyl-tRNA formyltransferase [Omnitrophica bacterium GWA2_41_15]|nr:MAG: methionyl-tRNA formyltransferase [Omnitrophica bacterium GWA2_41_15]HAZ09878.1 methionyl-tRNA formyltransferase [Candidatus Omnitrophota bacterium]
MKIVFFGSSNFAVPILEELAKNENIVLVITQPDRQKGRSLKIAPTAVKSKAEELGIETFQPAKVNSKESIEFLRKFNADLFIVVSFGQILSKPALRLPKLYCLNIHASLLPKYRGAAPINWAIANGEKETGVTIMRMNEKMDEGDIILKEILPVSEQDNAITLSGKLSIKGANILLDAIRLIRDNEVEFIAQDHTKATYAPKLKKEDGLINWADSADEICNRIRAFTPWPGCFISLNKKMLKIWKAKPVMDLIDRKSTHSTHPGLKAGACSGLILSGHEGRSLDPVEVSIPGAILEASKNGILVKTGKGALKIEELQLEGSRRMTAKEFMAGHKNFSCINNV